MFKKNVRASDSFSLRSYGRLHQARAYEAERNTFWIRDVNKNECLTL